MSERPASSHVEGRAGRGCGRPEARPLDATGTEQVGLRAGCSGLACCGEASCVPP